MILRQDLQYSTPIKKKRYISIRTPNDSFHLTMSPTDAHLFRRQATTGAAGDDGDAASTSAAAGTPTSAAAPETTSQAPATSAAPETTSQGELPVSLSILLSFSFPFSFSFWVFCCLCVVSVCLRACVSGVLLCVSVRFWFWDLRRYAFRLGVTKKRVLLARARSVNPANPNKRSVGTQNDIINHTTRTFAITIWISPPVQQYTLFLSPRINYSSRPLRRAETRQESESYCLFRTR